ncbi:hypothetical protein SNE40_018524 [Patella caerulea]|uniref:DNA helicase n=1 Tax=Patella caerulea TaxID=87958 RepID=A0AAN8PC47_PATCE
MSGAKISTLLQYRFVKRTSDQNTDPQAQLEEKHINGNSLVSENNTNGNSYYNEQVNSENSTTVIPDTPQSTTSSLPLSPVFNSTKVKIIKRSNSISSDSQSQDSMAESPSTQNSWLSKERGIQNGHVKTQKTKPKKQRRIIRPHSSSESESEDEKPSLVKCDDSSSATNTQQSSVQFEESLANLKQMFPTMAEDRLITVLKNNPDNFDSAVDELIYPPLPGTYTKRKGSDIENQEPSKKRIRQDSPTSTDNNGTTISTKEKNLQFLYEAFPNHTEEMIKATFQENKYAVDATMATLEKRVSLKTNSAKMKKTVKKVKMKDVDLSDEDADYSGADYDSDDSYDSDNAAVHADKILKFFQESKLEELTSIQGCSKKKAESILELRPFTSFDELVEKITAAKSLTYGLIPGCLEVIHLQSIVTNLMQKCERIGQEMENVVSMLTNSETIEDSQDNITNQPKLLVDTKQLKAYQMIGLNWLRVMHAQQLNGILADEMGLGKTIQTIAFLAHLIEVGETGPHVIIVPSSTIENWLREMQDWCPSLNIVIYYGSQEERRVVRQQVLYGNSVEYNVVLTTYNMATGSVEDRSLFKKLEFQYAVFDEGHMLKNMSSLRFQNLMKIRADRRLLLTGTPLQNNLVELMSLLCFVMPDIFSGKTEPLKKMFTMMTKSNEDSGRFEKEKIAQAKRIMKPFLLRRLKKDVLSQMPKKYERTENCVMIPDQQELYDSLIQKFNQEIEDRTDAVLQNGGASMFMQLRKAANHPLLIRKHYDDEKLTRIAKDLSKEPSHRERGALPELIKEDMSIMNDFDIHNVCKHYKSHVGKYMLDQSTINESGKFRVLETLLPDMKEKEDRVLLFSQFTMMLDIVEVFLKDKGYKFFRLDGSTPVPERQKLIDDYNNDRSVFIFLLSTKAGGLGINLTAANTVILHDIDFNPYNDKQAEDRCHRMGQKRDVNIIRLISKGTVEDGMMRVARDKLKLEKDVTTSSIDEEDNSNDVLSLLREALQRKSKSNKSDKS